MADVSITLLTRNGGTRLGELLEGVCAQKTSHAVEIVAIDSGSTDGTPELLKRFGARVQSIPPSEFNFGATRDRVYALATGEYLATLSQDAVPASDRWLDNLIAPFADPTVAAVKGDTLLPPPPARIFYWELIGHFYYTRETRRWLAKYHLGFSNVNSALRRAVWNENRIGRSDMSEDHLLQRVWAAKGYRFVFAPQAAVYHAHDYNLRGIVKRCENEGLGCRQMGEPYSLGDCLLDLADLQTWGKLAGSILRGARPTRAELLFPLIRPLFIWKGRHWTTRYVG